MTIGPSKSIGKTGKKKADFIEIGIPDKLTPEEENALYKKISNIKQPINGIFMVVNKIHLERKNGSSPKDVGGIKYFFDAFRATPPPPPICLVVTNINSKDNNEFFSNIEDAILDRKDLRPLCDLFSNETDSFEYMTSVLTK